MRDDAPTRERVASTILRIGPTTAVDLAERLELTPAAVRRHLDHLLAEGAIEVRDRRTRGPRGRGRPAKVFAVTEKGRDRFGHSYDTLATEALAFLRKEAGDEAVEAFARGRLGHLEHTLREAVGTATPEGRAQALADALNAEGFAATMNSNALGVQVCQHHCPVAHVAEEFPELCEAEAEMFADVLGTHVQRLATIAHGDGVCTTHVPTISIDERKS